MIVGVGFRRCTNYQLPPTIKEIYQPTLPSNTRFICRNVFFLCPVPHGSRARYAGWPARAQPPLARCSHLDEVARGSTRVPGADGSFARAISGPDRRAWMRRSPSCRPGTRVCRVTATLGAPRRHLPSYGASPALDVDGDARRRRRGRRHSPLTRRHRGCVHGEPATGVLNPIVRSRAWLTITGTDSATRDELGAHPLTWPLGLDAVSAPQKESPPVRMSPVSLHRALRAGPGRILYLTLLEDYWVRRKYHHTLSSPLLFALREALAIVEEETLEARWSRHERHHLGLVRGLEALGLELLPPKGERLWTLNAVRVPAGVDDLAVRQRLLKEFNTRSAPGLGPLAGKGVRVGLIGRELDPRIACSSSAGRSSTFFTTRAMRLHLAVQPPPHGGPGRCGHKSMTR